jgi:hypothetical protein
MAVVIGSERNIKVTAEDNSTLSKSPTFHCSPADQVKLKIRKLFNMITVYVITVNVIR